ncbi:MAG: DMT family transporter [Eubacteriales bacterium]|jgi:drug/metabolite transporter (DMT)-like permease|nr:DMT family transporter [Bacillota bacterium]MDQ7789944.1 DMT family transporter [Clostridia bacterium]MDZ4042256.1 DMT family transporter [Eubacteriales bacterium]MDZ7609634.1 DMT family transporter [Eubacteriales bacterium]
MNQEMNQGKNHLAFLLLFLTPMFWGGAFVAAKYVVPELHPVVAASVRFLLSFLVLFPVLMIWEGPKSLPALRDVPLLMFLGLTGIFTYNVLFFYGLQTSQAADGALVVASSPVFTAIIAAIWLKERFCLGQMAGFALCILGVVTIIAKGSPQVLLNREYNPGDLLLVGCAISWALYSVAGKLVMQRMSPLASTTYAVGFGAVFLTVAAIPFGSWEMVVGMSVSAIWGLLFLALFASGVAYVFWFTGVKKVGAGRSSVFVNFVPFWAAIAGVVILSEQLALFHLVGAVLTVGGAYLVTTKKAKVAAGILPVPPPVTVSVEKQSG